MEMKKSVAFLSFACFLFLLTTLIVPGTQVSKQLPRKEAVAASRIPPRISSVSQEFYNLAVNLVVKGIAFPAKSSGNLYHKVRLVLQAGPGVSGGDVFFFDGNRVWSSTKIEEFLAANIPAGRRYKIGMVEFEGSNPNNKTLISNEVEYLLLMNVDKISPNPVPQGMTEVVVATANKLGPQGAKKVMVGNHQAQVINWGASPAIANFRIRIPGNLDVPGVYDLYVEENGTVVSNKATLRLQGP